MVYIRHINEYYKVFLSDMELAEFLVLSDAEDYAMAYARSNRIGYCGVIGQY